MYIGSGQWRLFGLEEVLPVADCEAHSIPDQNDSDHCFRAKFAIGIDTIAYADLEADCIL